MRRPILFLLAVPAALLAQTLEPLPVPLQLPPGLTQTLPLNSQGSYYADAVRIVDCPKDEDNPFGTCANLLFGGYAMYASQLSGFVEIRFDPPRRNMTHFEISHPGNLRGRPTRMKAPQLYEFPLEENVVFDAFENVSEGDLNLITGEVTNLKFYANFFNKFYDAFSKSNPRLKIGKFSFPGAYGTTFARFEQRDDGLLDLSFHGTTFLPLGNRIEGDRVRIPLPLCGVESYCNTIEAPGTSFHPSIQYTTKMDHPSTQGECGQACQEIPFNTLQVFWPNTYYTSFLDRFNLNIPALGGHATSRTHFQGRFEVQFGDRSGDIVPVAIVYLPPDGLIGKADDGEVILHTFLPLSSNKGSSIGLFGHNEAVTFPSGMRYFPRNVNLSTDPFDGGRGAINLRTGKFVWDLLMPGFLTHDFIMKVLEQNDGRIPLSSFTMRGPANIERNERGEWMLRADTRTFRNYETLLFPAPDYVKAHGMIAGMGSFLDPAFRMQAVRPTPPANVTKSGEYKDVLAFIGDRFSIKYSIPCDARGKSASFEYTNANPNTGGTFHMQNLVSVTCANSRGSRAISGDYDTISFTGFGLWSRDPNELDPHVASVNLYFDSPEGTYISVQVDGGIASVVHTKPPHETLP